MPADPFYGQIACFAFGFAPSGWAQCNGQLLPVAQNTGLFSLLMTHYGGNGKTNFALPNLSGRFPLGQGSAPGLTPRTIGEEGGQDEVALGVAEIPAHTHGLRASSSAQTTNRPGGAVPAADGAYGAPGDGFTFLDPEAVGATGGSQAHENMPPHLVLNFCIALGGRGQVFPSRP